MSIKKRDRALQHRVRERQDKTGESYQAAWRSLTGGEPVDDTSGPSESSSYRIPLPLSTEGLILPRQYAQITAHPQVPTFWPDRLLIKNAESWDIQELTIKGKDTETKHSLIELGHQDTAVFSFAAWHPLAPHEVLCGDAIVLVAKYRGNNQKGERFEAALFGWEDRPPTKMKQPGPASSSRRISESALSPHARPTQTIKLPWTIASPSLFVDRVLIADAEDWIVNDIQVRGASIFVQSGDVPAVMFSEVMDVVLGLLKKGDLVYVLATYIGLKTSAQLAIELSGAETAPSTTQALSYFLPMSTTASPPVLPEQSAQITARPQVAFFQPERIVIADSANWVVNDVKIGNGSRFAQAGDIPALTFDCRTIGSHVMFGRVQTAQDFIIYATRIPDANESAPFFCGVQGSIVEDYDALVRSTHVRSADVPKREASDYPRLVLPLTPSEENAHRVGDPIHRIPPNQKTRITMRPIHGAFALESLSVSNAGTDKGSADWIVNEIKIDGHPQQVPKDMPGTLFSSGSRARVSFAGLDVIERDRELTLTVTYVGSNSDGCPFYGAATGKRPAQNPTVIPIAVSNPLKPTSKVTIRVSAASAPFQIEHFIIEDENTAGGSADWIVNDLRLGVRSQFAQSGDIPGDLFATSMIGTFVKFDPWPTDATLEIDVTYIGLNEEGAIFTARLEGTVLRDDDTTAPPDMRVFVEEVGCAGTVVNATCDFRPPATSFSVP